MRGVRGTGSFESPWPDNPVVVEVRRSGFLESVHRGALVVVGPGGEELYCRGYDGPDSPGYRVEPKNALDAGPGAR